MVTLASDTARGRVRTTAKTTTTATVESRKMAVILQIIGWQGQAWSLGLPCTSLTLDIHVMINWHLSKQADQCHVTISLVQVCNSSMSSVFLSWPLTKCWFFYWIADSCQVNLLKTGQDCSEASYRWPWFKIYSNDNLQNSNQNSTFS